ncbi:MAG: hypothetical protein M0C28_03915 [Candidatus Moduliflexus flocculans]|nr:hypothetical protein [Candidatus Moduliflexus flocculans]
MPHNRVEQDFFKTYGMTIVAGRDFSEDIPTDAAEAFILNETAVRRLGFKSPEAALGAAFGTFAPNRNGPGHRRRPRLQLRVHAPGHRAHRDLRRRPTRPTP